jgi:hypothetical protein
MSARPKKNAKRAKARKRRPEAIGATASSALTWPDFAARRKKIFGDRVLSVVDDFLKYRHRDWEQ